MDDHSSPTETSELFDGEEILMEAKTVIVSGAARGGTSLAAALCHHLGIPMGKGGPRYENPYLQWAALAGRWDVVEELAIEISREQPLWGWKLPALHQHLDRVSLLVPNPRFVFITKDVGAIANRRNRSGDPSQLPKYISRALRVYSNLAKFADRGTHPVLFLSYELVMRDITAAARELADFVGVEPSSLADVERNIMEDHVHYRTGPFPPRVPTTFDLRLEAIIDRSGVPRGDMPVAVDAHDT